MTVLVLGGGSDIAAAIVERLPGDPAPLLLCAREPDVAAARFAGRPGVVAIPWDATAVESHVEVLGALLEAHAPVDLVICAVGLLGHHAGLTMGPDDVDLMFRTNTSGPAAALSAIAPRLEPGATILVLSSVAGVRPRRSNYVYGSSKAGLDAFALGLADAVVDRGVRVLVVRPGFVTSSMTEGLDPAPFATDPATVGDAVVRALRGGRSGVVYVPGRLGPMFRIIRALPTSLWRRIAGDR